MPCSRRVLVSRPVAGPGSRLTPAPRAFRCSPPVRRRGCCGPRSRPGRARPRTRRSRCGRATAWPRRSPRTPSRPGSRATTGRLSRTCGRAGRLVREHARERGPARIVDAAGEPGAGQPGHGEILHVHRLVLTDDRGGQLVQPVPAGVPDPGMAAGNLPPRALPARGALLTAGQLALGGAQLRGGLAGDARRVDLAAADSTAKCVRPRSIPTRVDRRERGVGGVDDERGVIPPGRVHRDGHRAARTAAPRPAHRHVPDPGSRSAGGGDRNRAALVNRIDCARSRRDRNRGAPSRRPLRRP